MLTAFAGRSQTSKDTTCLPNEQLKKALVLIEQGKIDKAELEQVKEQRAALLAAIDVKDARIANYERLSVNCNDQIRLRDETILSLNKSLKNQRRKTLIMGGAALFMAATMTFLFNH